MLLVLLKPASIPPPPSTQQKAYHRKGGNMIKGAEKKERIGVCRGKETQLDRPCWPSTRVGTVQSANSKASDAPSRMGRSHSVIS